MNLDGPPLRFLFTVVSLWAGGRVAVVMWDEAGVARARAETEWVSNTPARKVAPVVGPAMPAAAEVTRVAYAAPARSEAARAPAHLRTATASRRARIVRPAETDSGFDAAQLLVMASYGAPPSLPAPATDAQTAVDSASQVVLALDANPRVAQAVSSPA